MTSDHSLSHTDLDTISSQIRNDHHRHFDHKQVERFMATLKLGGLDAKTKEELVSGLLTTAGIVAVGAILYWGFQWLVQ